MEKLKWIVNENISWFLMHISSLVHSVVIVFKNEEKLLATLVYSLFRRVAISGFRIIP